IGSPEHHSESPEAYFAHTAGLRTISCSNPEDAFWMIQQAIECDDPVMFFEPKRRYHDRAEYDIDAAQAPRGLFEANVLREGTDVTLLGYGPVVKTMVESAAAAEAEGTSIEVIDLRSLSPLPIDTVVRSVKKTGRLVVVHEASSFLGMASEISAQVTEQCFYDLEAPVVRVNGANIPYPPSRMEEDFLPDLDRILDGVDRALSY
ncbi:MAG TPA: transketolase C-terminal domain-containing protein, partial [Ornithinibacter sp.]|nr:transketolase C-terminal domain-containing protein [Ornithinibacter sp.]